MRVRIILAFFVLASTSLFAQTFRGTILGTVTDASGAVVSGAKVRCGTSTPAWSGPPQTSADGSYSVPELPHRHLHRDDLADRISDLGDQRTWQSMSPPSAEWMPR